ncbi:AmmeMemoRadiSam system radical SAM enzyme [Halosegnis sp.]|uniref:AmmeMemoRadiSam system radical SAM enzyme n=1 Tax=Halosegnis sp. TaxID=2864959 RepID=UPI0035D4440A
MATSGDPADAGRETEHYERDGKTVRCGVCPRRCVVPPGEQGVCGVRENHDGRLLLTTHGQAVSASVDPIEKKPLFHVAPGASVLSIATKGCNFACDFCQNYRIALEYDEADVTEMTRSPETLAARVGGDVDGLAYTYTEPTVFMEYALDTMRAAPPSALQVFVSNGYMTTATVDTLAPHLDAINVDLKGDAAFYREHVGVPDPDPIYETIERFREHGVHVEVTNLLVPGENDAEPAVRERLRRLRDIADTDLPLHFSRFHPAYQLQDRRPTPVDTLERALDVARELGFDYVYCGNVPGHESESTHCPGCGRLLVRREGFAVRELALADGTCPDCGHEIPLVGEPRGTTRGRPRPFA